MSKLIATIVERNELALLTENASSGSIAARLIEVLKAIPYVELDTDNYFSLRHGCHLLCRIDSLSR